MSAPDAIDPALASLRAVVQPLARLAVGKGVPYAQLEEELKQAMVEAAREALVAQSDRLLPHRLASRITTMTGINRREVTRITRDRVPATPPKPSPALRVFARWVTDASCLDTSGHPLVLPVQGPAPSFEGLATRVTRDVHYRSLLDELVRLGAVAEDAEAKTVRVQREVLVPEQSEQEMLRFLAKNVGDHLSVAVDNVLGDQPKQLEQSVYADGLSTESLNLLKPVIEAHWRAVLAELTPLLQRRVDADAALDVAAHGAVRVGMYARIVEESISADNAGDTAAGAVPGDQGEPT